MMKKTYIHNSIFSALIWCAFNGFFLLLNIVFNEYILYRYGLMPSKEEKTKVYVTAFIIILVLLALSSMVLYYLGKGFLIKGQNNFLNFASVFFIHPIILLLLYLAVQSEATMISAINWFMDLCQNAVGISNWVYDSFALNAWLTFIPYCCLALGLYKQKKAEDTLNQVRASE